MKSAILGCLTAMTIGVAGASAQSATDKTGASAAAPAVTAPRDAAASATSAQKDAFITRQAPGTLRAPKLVGVTVYDSANKSVGKIDDLLLDHDGTVKAVVIGMGGFLGMGRKDVAVPYSEIQWKTEQRKVEVNQPAAGGAAAPAGSSAKPETKTIAPADTEAYQGYPDRAVLAMTQDQLKAAPDFKYAQDPSIETRASANDATMPASKK
jgi:sporulation protein YlmC with PRC-barrel domain